MNGTEIDTAYLDAIKEILPGPKNTYNAEHRYDLLQITCEEALV